MEEPEYVDVVHLGQTLRLNEQLIEPNCDLFILMSKHPLKIPDARAPVHVNDERVILRLLRNNAKSIEGTEQFEEVTVPEDPAECNQVVDLLAGNHVDLIRAVLPLGLLGHDVEKGRPLTCFASLKHAVLRFQFLRLLGRDGFGNQELAVEFASDEVVLASKWRSNCVGASFRALLLRALVLLGRNIERYLTSSFSVNSNISLLDEFVETVLEHALLLYRYLRRFNGKVSNVSKMFFD